MRLSAVAACEARGSLRPALAIADGLSDRCSLPDAPSGVLFVVLFVSLFAVPFVGNDERLIIPPSAATKWCAFYRYALCRR